MELDILKPKDTLKKIDSIIKKNGRLIVSINPVLKSWDSKETKKTYLKSCLELGFDDIYSLFVKRRDSINIDV